MANANVAKLNLPLASIDTATGRTKEVLEAGRKSASDIPNMYAGMANSPALLDTSITEVTDP